MYTPKLPVNYIKRQEELEMVVDALLHKRTASVTAITAALRGAGGFGKSTLANAVCADDRIHKKFPDGVQWIDLGEKINQALIAEKINHLLRALNVNHATFTDYHDASKKLRETLKNRRVLLVIDDVWNSAHLEPFLQGGVECAHLVTTRNSNTLPHDSNVILVDSASPSQALRMLGEGLPEGENELLQEFSEKLWNWPLLLGLANGQLRKEITQNHSSLRKAVEKAIQLYESRGLTAFDLKNPIERGQAAGLALDISVEQLDNPDKEKLFLLGIFPENTSIPLSTLQALWNRNTSLSFVDIESYCSQFASASFIQQYDAETGSFRIHAVIREYLGIKLGGKKAEAHRDLLEGYLELHKIHAKQWWLVPDDHYYYQNLISHFLSANMHKASIELLFNYLWLKTILKIGGIPAIVRDSESVLDFVDNDHEFDGEIQLLQDFFRLSAHVLNQDIMQLPSQIVGRLMDFEKKHLDNLVEMAKVDKNYMWLRPSQRYFTPPGGSEVMMMKGHTRSITSLALSSDEFLLASGSEEGVIKIWDLHNGENLHTFNDHDASINSLLFIPNGKLLISTTQNGCLGVWNIEIGSCVHLINKTPLEITSTVLSGDGNYVIFKTNDGKVRSLCLADMKVSFLERAKGSSSVNLVASEKKNLLFVTSDKNINVWDINKGKCIQSLRGHENAIVSLALSQNGKRLISVSNENILKFWDVEKGKCLCTFTQKTTDDIKITNVGLTARGRRAMVITNDYKVKVWNPETGRPINILKGHENLVNNIASTLDEKKAISYSNDRTIRVWNLDTSECINVLKGHTNKINSLLLTRNERRVISGAGDKTIKIWNLNVVSDISTVNRTSHDHRYESSRHVRPVNDIVLEPAGKYAVSISQDSKGKIWQIETGTCIKTLSRHSKPLNALTFSPDGSRILMGGGDGYISVWNSYDGKQLLHIKTPARYNLAGVTSLLVTNDGRYIISGLRDSTINFWSLETGKNVMALEKHWVYPPSKSESAPTHPKVQGITALRLTNSGSRLISAGSDCTIRIWDTQNGRCLRTLREHKRFVTDIATSLDSYFAVSASYDSKIKIWEIESGRCVRTLSGHSSPVRSVRISPNYNFIVSAASDGNIRIWDFRTGKCENILSGHTDRVNDIAVSPDGKWVISAANDMTVKIWDVNSGNCLVTFRSDVPFYKVCFHLMKTYKIIAGDHKGNVLFLDIIEPH